MEVTLNAVTHFALVFTLSNGSDRCTRPVQKEIELFK